MSLMKEEAFGQFRDADGRTSAWYVKHARLGCMKEEGYFAATAPFSAWTFDLDQFEMLVFFDFGDTNRPAARTWRIGR